MAKRFKKLVEPMCPQMNNNNIFSGDIVEAGMLGAREIEEVTHHLRQSERINNQDIVQGRRMQYTYRL